MRAQVMLPLSAGRTAHLDDLVTPELLAGAGRGIATASRLRAALATPLAPPAKPAARTRRSATTRRSDRATPTASRRRAEPARPQRPAARARQPSWYLTEPSTPSWKL